MQQIQDITPGEGSRPLSIFRDQYSEEFWDNYYQMTNNDYQVFPAVIFASQN